MPNTASQQTIDFRHSSGSQAWLSTLIYRSEMTKCKNRAIFNSQRLHVNSRRALRNGWIRLIRLESRSVTVNKRTDAELLHEAANRCPKTSPVVSRSAPPLLCHTLRTHKPTQIKQSAFDPLVSLFTLRFEHQKQRSLGSDCICIIFFALLHQFISSW